MVSEIEKRVLSFIARARPFNDNVPTLRLARQERVDQLLRQLNDFKPRATVYLQPEGDECGGFRNTA